MCSPSATSSFLTNSTIEFYILDISGVVYLAKNWTFNVLLLVNLDFEGVAI